MRRKRTSPRKIQGGGLNGNDLNEINNLNHYIGMKPISIGAFYYRLYTYGHNLDPHAPVHIEPFMPLLFGRQQIANFTQSSYPMLGTYLLCVFMALLLLAMWFSRKEEEIS